MSLNREAIVAQIDTVLIQARGLANGNASQIARGYNLMLSAIHRLTLPGSVYAGNLHLYEATLASNIAMSMQFEALAGMLEAVKDDYQSGYVETAVELLHAETFSDFLDMAQYLIEQGYKDASGVITGSVLEAHLRKLSEKYGVSVSKPDGKPQKAEALNAELAGKGVYNLAEQKQVTAWLDLRNKAAHGQYDQYDDKQVRLMLQGIRDFILRNPA
jgi:uncharacterized protein (DUF2164 family)